MPSFRFVHSSCTVYSYSDKRMNKNEQWQIYFSSCSCVHCETGPRRHSIMSSTITITLMEILNAIMALQIVFILVASVDKIELGNKMDIHGLFFDCNMSTRVFAIHYIQPVR